MRRLTDQKVQRILDFAADEAASDESVAVRETLTLPLASLVEDRFEIQGVIGQGGMAVVHRALDRQTGAAVALKICRMSLSSDLARLWREIAIIRRLDHPTIPKYVAHGRLDESTAFLAMELLLGETLQSRLTRGALPPASVSALAERIAGALAAAHGAGVVHRDVKPSNVFLVGGDPARGMLLDFGLARRTAMPGDLTATGAFIGTPGYAAPEQVRDAVSVGPAADVFSLGVVLYESLAGSSPFAAASRTDRLAKLLVEEPAPIDGVCPGASPALRALIQRALAKDANARPKDGAAVLAELGATSGAAALELILGRTLRSDEVAVDLQGTWRARVVDVRRYRAAIVRRPDAVERITRAARSACRLSHPLAAAPIGVIATDDELLVLGTPSAGRRLDELLLLAHKHGTAPSLDVCRSVALDVLEVLEAAHSLAGQAVVHGDVQARHVSLGLAGEAILAGLCSAAESAALPPRRRGRWTAPEHVAVGGIVVGPAADVFGAAALFVRLAAPPSDAGRTGGSAGGRGGGAAALRARLDGPLATAIERALRPEPRARGTLAELAGALGTGAERSALRAEVRAWVSAVGAAS